MKSITGLSPIHKMFDVFLVDLNGTIYDGKTLYPGVSECLTRLKAAQKQIVFLSNMPRGSDVAKKKLLDCGLDTAGCEFLTSGDAVRAQLGNPTDDIFKTLGTRPYHFGAETNTDLLEGLNVQTVSSLEEADYVILTKYTDWIETDAASKTFLERCLALKLPIVCANPDVLVVHDGRKRYTAGFFANHYEQMGGTVHYYGKPHPQIYHTIFERYGPQKKYLMVGDNLDTDIQGAQQAKIASLLVMTGNIEDVLSKDENLSLKKYIKEFGKPSPTYVAPHFTW